METISDKYLLRIPDVVAATGLSRSFIYQRIASGELKVVRIGRTVRVRIEDMNNWINEQSS